MKTVGYLRLSKDDGDDIESTSITNQRKIILDFALNNGFTIDDWYVDDGVSGYTINRPDYQRLMNDLNDDKVGTVIAKDLSRLGRNNAQINLFLDNMYEVGKRVIAIGDNYDTYNERSHEMVGIHTWMNDKYVKDVSRKVRTSIQTMQKEGRWICSLPYGYMHDPIKKGEYYPDPTCSHYVKMVYDMYINGMGISTIARQLTYDNVPTSSMIRKQRMEREGRISKIKVTNKWEVTTVRNMLTNEFYTGVLIQRKTKVRTINGKRVSVDKSEQYRHENAHEALIDKYTFDLVQDIVKQRSNIPYRGKRIKNRKNLFVGMMKCADCGSRMTSTGSLDNTRYVCDNYNRYGKNYCTNHAILEYDIQDSLIYLLQHCRDNLQEVLQDIDIIIKEDNDRVNPSNTLEMLQKDLSRVKNEVFVLMEQKALEAMGNPSMAEMINSMYKEMMDKKYKEIASIEKQIEDQKINIDESTEIKENFNNALQVLNDVIETKELTKKQVMMLVDHINVHDDGGLDIFLKGDLHEVCNNHVHIEKCQLDKMLEETVEEILIAPDFVSPTRIWHVMKDKGYTMTYTRYRDLVFNKVFDANVLEPIGVKRGYKLIVDQQTLYVNVGLNTDGKSTSSCINNSVTIEIIKKISKWGHTLIMHNKKILF